MKTTKTLQTIKMMGFISIMILSVSNFANANAIVKGHVLSDHNEPLEYATATLICPETMKIAEGDMCNNEGEFIIENVEPGEYILSVRKVGFEKDETKRITVVDHNEIHEISKVVLNESNIMLNEVEVAAPAEEKSVSNFANRNAIVKGHVLSDHNEPLEYATVTLISPETMKIAEGDMCNNEGEFIIENVEPGEYILSVRKVGFEKNETKRITVVDQNEIHEINKVVLNESNIMLNEVEVVAHTEKKELVESL